jgi:hypothetical protein
LKECLYIVCLVSPLLAAQTCVAQAKSMCDYRTDVNSSLAWLLSHVGSGYWPAWQVGFNVLLCPIKHQYLPVTGCYVMWTFNYQVSMRHHAQFFPSASFRSLFLFFKINDYYVFF